MIKILFVIGVCLFVSVLIFMFSTLKKILKDDHTGKNYPMF